MAPKIIETAWTRAAAERVEKRSDEALTKSPPDTNQYELPELRIYNRQQQLIFHAKGANPGQTAATLDRVISADRSVAGPTYQETVADLETLTKQPAAQVLTPGQRTIIFDYWAEWCVPCKALEKELLAWAAHQPPHAIEIVRVEADLMKLARSRGEKIIMMKQGADGKIHKVEMN